MSIIVDILCYGGGRYNLPQLFFWEISHGCGSPCDSISLSCAYDKEMAEILPRAYRIEASHEGKRVFYGVVDEWEAQIEQTGAFLHINGRGMAALLLDNEVEAAEFGLARLEDILNLYVKPFGITDIERKKSCSVENFIIQSGSCAWNVLYTFLMAGMGTGPRFSPQGSLVIGAERGENWKIGPEMPVSSLRRVDQRYGQISQVLVKNPVRGTRETVDNPALLARGGSCRRVLQVPRYTSYDKMRWTGDFQIQASTEGKDRVELRLPSLFVTEPGDLVHLNRPEAGLYGTYQVWERVVSSSRTGAGTQLTLRAI